MSGKTPPGSPPADASVDSDERRDGGGRGNRSASPTKPPGLVGRVLPLVLVGLVGYGVGWWQNKGADSGGGLKTVNHVQPQVIPAKTEPERSDERVLAAIKTSQTQLEARIARLDEKIVPSSCSCKCEMPSLNDLLLKVDLLGKELGKLKFIIEAGNPEVGVRMALDSLSKIDKSVEEIRYRTDTILKRIPVPGGN